MARTTSALARKAWVAGRFEGRFEGERVAVRNHALGGDGRDDRRAELLGEPVRASDAFTVPPPARSSGGSRRRAGSPPPRSPPDPAAAGAGPGGRDRGADPGVAIHVGGCEMWTDAGGRAEQGERAIDQFVHLLDAEGDLENAVSGSVTRA